LNLLAIGVTAIKPVPPRLFSQNKRILKAYYAALGAGQLPGGGAWLFRIQKVLFCWRRQNHSGLMLRNSGLTSTGLSLEGPLAWSPGRFLPRMGDSRATGRWMPAAAGKPNGLT